MLYENVTIQSETDINIRGWFIKHNQTIYHPTLVYFHENPGNIGLRMDFLKLLNSDLKANILIIAYRGYSDSDGIPSEKGL